MVYIFLALIPYVVFVLANRYASQRIDVAMVVAIVNIVATIVLVGLVAVKSGKPTAEHLNTHMMSYIAAAIGGLGIAAYSFFLAKAFAMTNVAIVLPLVLGGIIVLGSLAAYVVFREKINVLQLAGLVVVVIGMGIIVFAKLRPAV
ncbi:MAG TPA: EamA family transporter [Candidatus Saccharimonadales bacterium]|nr:EamA family transporter [Candidatus Saccharimonadales bacterium]